MKSKTPEFLAEAAAILMLAAMVIFFMRAMATTQELREAADITRHVAEAVTNDQR